MRLIRISDQSYNTLRLMSIAIGKREGQVLEKIISSLSETIREETISPLDLSKINRDFKENESAEPIKVKTVGIDNGMFALINQLAKDRRFFDSGKLIDKLLEMMEGKERKAHELLSSSKQFKKIFSDK